MKIGAAEPIAALNRVRIRETGEPLVDVREACPDVEVHEDCCPYLRATVARMVQDAQARLPRGLRLRVSTALRTLHRQSGLWDGYFAQMIAQHPEWPLSALRRATNRYFAPYDQPAPPGHCTGGAVDVQLLDAEGVQIDLSAPHGSWDVAYTWTDRISPEARRDRMILVEAMLAAGFSNCREEYWHYSWGDSAWAVRVGERVCPYGLVAAPVVVEAGFEGGAAADIGRDAGGTWTVAPAADGRAAVGVYWAPGDAVDVRLVGCAGVPLHISADRSQWEPAAPRIEGADAVLCAELEGDRMWIATHPGEVPPSVKRTGHRPSTASAKA